MSIERPNSEALNEQMKIYVQEAVDNTLKDKNAVKDAIDIFEEAKESGEKIQTAVYQMYSRLNELTLRYLLKEHGVEISDAEASEISDASIANDQSMMHLPPDKQARVDKITLEYESVDIREIIKDTIAGDGSEQDVEQLKNYLS